MCSCQVGWLLMAHFMSNVWSSQDSEKFVCPDGYKLQPGDIPGSGQIGGNPSIETDVLGCSIRCNELASCCSFEYSPTEKYCNLNKDCSPTESVQKDYAFCTKGNIAHRIQTYYSDRHPNCYFAIL